MGRGRIWDTIESHAGPTYERTIEDIEEYLADVPATARVAQQEIFGPVTMVKKFATLDEAIAKTSTVISCLSEAVSRVESGGKELGGPSRR